MNKPNQYPEVTEDRTQPLPGEVQPEENGEAEHPSASEEAQSEPSRRRVFSWFSMMTASGIILYLEILFFHVLVYVSNYIEANAIISVALMGVALGGLLGYALRRFKLGFLLPYLAVLTALGITGCCLNIVFLPRLLSYPVLLILPFLLPSAVVAFLFVDLREYTAYFWNLSGATLGVVLACFTIPAVRSENALLLSIVFCGVLSFFLAMRGKRRFGGVALAVLLVVGGGYALLLNLHTDAFNFARLIRPPQGARADDAYSFQNKIFGRIGKGRGEIMHARDNLVARVDIIKIPGSRNPQTYQEGVISDHVLKLAPRQYSWDVRVPNALVVPDPKILVIGTSAEGVTKTAKHLSKTNPVVGVEINPAIVDLMKNELFEASAKAYEDVDIHVEDARTFLERTDQQFDLITMMNTHTRGRIRQNAGMPQYLFTREAFSLMFERLTGRGAIVIEEVRVSEKADDFVRKIMASMVDGLRTHGVSEDFERHFYAYTYRVGSWRYIILMCKKTPFSPQDVQRMDRWFDIKSKRYCINVKELTKVVHPEQPLDSTFALFLRDPQNAIQRELSENRINLGAISDDRPFLFDLEVDYPEEWRVFRLSVWATLALVLVPCLIIFVITLRGRLAKGAVNLLYFCLLGVAFMLVELSLMQQYQLFLGSPIYSLAIVLSSILLFSSLGSLASGFFPDWLRKLCILLIPVLLLVFAHGLPLLMKQTQALPFNLKAALALATLFPLFFCMGVPFPYGLSVVRKTLTSRHIPLVYGVNGAFGTIGATGTLLISVYYGFTVTLYLGIALYAAAFATVAMLSRVKA